MDVKVLLKVFFSHFFVLFFPLGIYEGGKKDDVRLRFLGMLRPNSIPG